MKKVLITGAYGFLGRYSALQFSKEGYEVSGLGHGRWHEHEFNKWGITNWYESTITFEALINLNKTFDVIVHCGGSGSVNFSYQNPYEDFQKSVQSTLALLEYIRLCEKPCHFIYPSSAAVHGDVGDTLITETSPLNPISPYGFHKKSAEELCLSYSRNFGIKVSIIRYFSIYGAGLQKQLLWDACMKIKSALTEVNFFGTGEETRDWIYVTDAASLITSIASGATEKLTIVNGGSGIRSTIETTIDLLISTYGKQIQNRFNYEIKPGDPRFYWADITSASKFGWSPTITLEQGLGLYVEYFKNLVND